MGKLKCVCGNILSDTWGNDAEAFVENQSRRNDMEDEVYMVGDGRGILECEECGTLAIENPLNSSKVSFYMPDNDKCNYLFKGKKDVSDGK